MKLTKISTNIKSKTWYRDSK